MSYLELFHNDMWSVIPEFFRVFSISALLTYGAIMGTRHLDLPTSPHSDLHSDSHSNPRSTTKDLMSLPTPVLGMIMNRLMAITMRIAAALVANGAYDVSTVSQSSSYTLFNGIRLRDAATDGDRKSVV